MNEGTQLARVQCVTAVCLHTEFDRHELQIYEEMAKMPPFQRKTLVLIGAQGVGRRSLKNRLIVFNPTFFGTTVPCESRLGHQSKGTFRSKAIGWVK